MLVFILIYNICTTKAITLVLPNSIILNFRYIQLLWTIEFAETHVGRSHSHAFDICSADLQVR